MRQELEPCFILHQRPFKETSIILDVFSEEHGRLSILAKGAKRMQSPLKKVLHPFVPLLLSWTGRSDLKTLVEGQANSLAPWLQGISLFTALYVNELLVKALNPMDPYKLLYQQYQEVIQALGESENNTQKIQASLRLFESQLLKELGYGLELEDGCNSKLVLRSAIQTVLGDKIIHSRILVKKLLLGI